MFKIKKYILVIISLLLEVQCGYASSHIEVYKEDLVASKTRSLISGVNLDDLLKPAKAVITLGFKECGGPFTHSSLVFEMPVIATNKEIIFSIQGIHFGANDNSCCDFDSFWGTACGAVFGGGKGKVHVDSPRDVIMKFVRAQEITTMKKENQDGIDDISEKTTPLPPCYTKYKSFIVDIKKAKEAIELSKIDKDKGTHFALKGWGITNRDNTYNCTSYAVAVLKRAGIDLPDISLLDGGLIKDTDYITNMIERYELRPLSERNGVKIIKPASAQELVER